IILSKMNLQTQNCINQQSTINNLAVDLFVFASDSRLETGCGSFYFTASFNTQYFGYYYFSNKSLLPSCAGDCLSESRLFG
ncbi:MAG: hypothetical protein AAF639_25335, partial [Chloroflexota bacterium]